MNRHVPRINANNDFFFARAVIALGQAIQKSDDNSNNAMKAFVSMNAFIENQVSLGNAVGGTARVALQEQSQPLANAFIRDFTNFAEPYPDASEINNLRIHLETYLARLSPSAAI